MDDRFGKAAQDGAAISDSQDPSSIRILSVRIYEAANPVFLWQPKA
jgi:hypothetical protein